MIKINTIDIQVKVLTILYQISLNNKSEKAATLSINIKHDTTSACSERVSAVREYRYRLYSKERAHVTLNANT